jgi:CubicO group peptidase (beta-lactamase class C family)
MPPYDDICLLPRKAMIAAALIASMVAAKAQLAVPTPLPGTPEAYGAALKTWAARYNIDHALVVVRRQGEIVYRSTLGGAIASAPVHLASLSKTITGACIATLIRDRKLAFDTPLSASLAKFFAAYGKPVDPRVAGVTIAQLLTHRAGFSGDADDHDVDTVRKLVAYLRDNSARQPPKPELLITAFKTPLLHQPGRDYDYSNTGYLVLGAVIEEATGKSICPIAAKRCWRRSPSLATWIRTGRSWGLTAGGVWRGRPFCQSSTCSRRKTNGSGQRSRNGCCLRRTRRSQATARFGTVLGRISAKRELA